RRQLAAGGGDRGDDHRRRPAGVGADLTVHPARSRDRVMKPRRRESRPVKIATSVLVGIGIVAVYIFLYAPMIITALFSVNDAKIQTLPYSGFTTKWYTALFEDEKMVNAILYSLRVAVVAVSISACAAVILALIVHRMRVRGGAVIQALLASPL